ncbi:MAG: carboxypeptidase-like regulatory domain-containing protein, partial [Patescibacteria group bacterium]
FKLIGDMTVKQFAYLVSGIVLAWVVLQIPVFFLLKFPIAVIFAVLGLSLAYLPVQGRPFDVMISHFVRALISPTQFSYQKIGGRLYFPSSHSLTQAQKNQQSTPPPRSDDRLKIYLGSLPRSPRNKLDDREASFLSSLSNLTADSNTSPILKPKSQPAPQILTPVKNNQKPLEVNLSQNIATGMQVKKDINENPKEKAASAGKTPEATNIQEQAQKQAIDSLSHEKISTLESKLQEAMLQKQELTQELLSLKQKMEKENKNVFTPATATPKIETQNVKRVPPGMGKNIGLPTAPTIPNLITGIVKDPRGNALPNILVEVKDKDGNPVRAFKTNGLGRFLSATPLLNGVYTIDFEDPKGQNKFDAIEITVKNEIVMPLEVISIDTREILRKSLFGS